ncbi:hypothetical protein [Endozoicomonas sp. ALE010]|uniref:hypothetical protein n=1 Tax=Endozoicomonas sp. ALE010 TaxID=3403081 RepID=UPI003BB6D877
MLSFVAEVISTLADSLGIMDRVKKFIGHYEPASPIHQVADRIFQVFETHGVNRANIVGFVNPKHGITFADLISHDAFIPKITNELLDEISEKFSINPEWLTGDIDEIYPSHHCYKNLRVIIDHLGGIAEQGIRWPEVQVIIIKPSKPSLEELQSHRSLSPFAVVIREAIGDLGETTIYRDHLYDELNWGHQPARLHLQGISMAAWELASKPWGAELPENEIVNLLDRRVFIAPILEDVSLHSWHPDDYIFLDGESMRSENSAIAQEARKWMRQTGDLAYLQEWKNRLNSSVRQICD